MEMDEIESKSILSAIWGTWKGWAETMLLIVGVVIILVPELLPILNWPVIRQTIPDWVRTLIGAILILFVVGSVIYLTAQEYENRLKKIREQLAPSQDSLRLINMGGLVAIGSTISLGNPGDLNEAQLDIKSPYREIRSNELWRDYTIGESVALRELSTNVFRCDIRTDVHIATKEERGRIHFDAAVVRGEDLIAIDIYELTDRLSVPYFQLEHLIKIIKEKEIKFERFHKFMLYIFVRSSVAPEFDEPVRKRLEAIRQTSGIEMDFKVERLNTLRTKHDL